MKINKKISQSILFLVLLLFIASFIAAQSSTYSAGTNSYGYSTFTSFATTPSLYWDPQQCEAGQDFIVQIPPLGCEPVVVRSDLLEEQNVVVYCQLAATKLNPLINIKSLESISFPKKEYSSEHISNIGFHPAKAAISRTHETLLNSPIMENIGYATIVLKRQPNESAMPDFVEGNLTVRMRYDTKDSYGTGAAKYYLPTLEQEEWSQDYTQYGFWQGKGFLRAESIDTDHAVISIYSDESRKIESVNLKVGQKSNKIYMPGFYCLAGLEIKLEKLSDPDTRAKFEIDGEIVEVSEGESFLENSCKVLEIDDLGASEYVEVKCREDYSSKETILNFGIAPKIKLEIPDVEKTEFSIGDWLYKSSDGRDIYLAYIGTEKDSNKEEKPFIYLFAKTEGSTSGITPGEIKKIRGEIDLDLLGKFVNAAKSAVPGDEWKRMDSGDVKDPFEGEVSFGGFIGPSNLFKLAEDVQLNYDAAIENYRVISNSFSEYTEEGSKETYGEEALLSAIELADKFKQNKDLSELCSELGEQYSSAISKVEKCNNIEKLSSSEFSSKGVLIKGVLKQLSFEGIYEPSFNEYGAQLLVKDSKGNSQTYDLQKNNVASLPESLVDKLQLVSLKEDSAKIKLDIGSGKEGSINEEITLKKDKSEILGGYTFSLLDINLEKQAKVSLNPVVDNVGTEANFSFKIGIEKRAIQLAPEEIAEKIKRVNKTLERLEEISESLGKTVETYEKICQVAGVVATFKNFASGLSGKSTARQMIMRNDGGWVDLCNEKIKDKGNEDFYKKSLDYCFLEHNDKINTDAGKMFEILKGQEGKITEKDLKPESTEIWDDLTNNLGAEKISDPYKEGGDEISLTGEGSLKDVFSFTAYEKGKISLSQIKDLELYNAIIAEGSGASSELIKMAEKERYKILNDVQDTSKLFVTVSSAESDANARDNMEDMTIIPAQTEGSLQGTYTGGKINGAPAQGIMYGGEIFWVILKLASPNEKIYSIEKVLNYDETDPTDKIKNAIMGKEDGTIKPLYNSFKEYDASFYENKYNNPEIKFFETEPYKGMPAIVPFDKENGWYVGVRQTVSAFGGIRAYDDSGVLASFLLCNVGKNSKPEYDIGINDDICMQFNPGTGQIYGTFPGLNPTESKKRVDAAILAIAQASRAYGSGKTSIRINAGYGILDLPIGSPAVNIPDISCQDFMSPKECLALFNACDPIICPPSRCNLGGTFHVSDVVSSGIIGSSVLCWPNRQEGIIVPVCLSGLDAGLNGIVSYARSYERCLETALEEGKTVGVCDQIQSVYACDLLWRNIAPVAEGFLPKIVEYFQGKTERNLGGGGEYIGGFQDAWSNTKNSVEWMKQTYSVSPNNAFQARSTKDIGGSEICKSYFSLVTPLGGDIFDGLLEAQAPPMYTGFFEEIPYTTATVPATSQYKVYFNIYAGEDLSAYYRVYLKGPEGGSFYQNLPTITVKDGTGFLEVGETVDKTIDFTAPSGYKQLCISVNGKETCDFKQVTTSFAVDYAREMYLSDEASKRDIKTSAECVSGTLLNPYSLLTPNYQGAAQDLASPDIYNEGIERVCATNMPGQNTNADPETGRLTWEVVGYCDDTDMKCWLNRDSVTRILESTVLEGQALGEQSAENKKYIDDAGYVADFEELKAELDKLETPQEKIDFINKNYDKVVFMIHKAKLLFIKAKAYGEIAFDLKVECNEEYVYGVCANPSKSTCNDDAGTNRYDNAQGLCGAREECCVNEEEWLKDKVVASTTGTGISGTTGTSGSDNVEGANPSREEKLDSAIKDLDKLIEDEGSSANYNSDKEIKEFIDELYEDEEGFLTKKDYRALKGYAAIGEKDLSYLKILLDVAKINPSEDERELYIEKLEYENQLSLKVEKQIEEEKNLAEAKYSLTKFYYQRKIDKLTDDIFDLQDKILKINSKLGIKGFGNNDVSGGGGGGGNKIIIKEASSGDPVPGVKAQAISDVSELNLNYFDGADSLNFNSISLEPTTIDTIGTRKKLNFYNCAEDAVTCDSLVEVPGEENKVELPVDKVEYKEYERTLDLTVLELDKITTSGKLKAYVYTDAEADSLGEIDYNLLKNLGMLKLEDEEGNPIKQQPVVGEIYDISDLLICKVNTETDSNGNINLDEECVGSEGVSEKDKEEIESQGCQVVLPSSDVAAISDSSERVLQAILELVGEPVPADTSHCFEAMQYAFMRAKANFECVYSDKIGKTYNVGGPSGSEEIVTSSSFEISSFVVNPERCPIADKNQEEKLENLKPGYLLSIYLGYSNKYEKDLPHSVIFVRWIDEEKKLAKLFDWNGYEYIENVKVKEFRYYEADLSDDEHPVYMYWEPVD